MTPAELEDYWEHLAARARANQLPIPEGYDKRAIPLGMYGDDARYNTSGSKLLMVTVNSILDAPRRDAAAN